jgi:hypothetical protein
MKIENKVAIRKMQEEIGWLDNIRKFLNNQNPEKTAIILAYEVEKEIEKKSNRIDELNKI